MMLALQLFGTKHQPAIGKFDDSKKRQENRDIEQDGEWAA
jgi:hypothetical protein